MVSLSFLLLKCQLVFKKSSYFCCYVTSGGQQEQSENSLQTLCLPLDYLGLTHTHELMASPNYDEGGNPAT